MLLKYKLQLFIIPLVILPVLISAWVFVNNTSSSIVQLQSDVMAYKLNVVEDSYEAEYSVLQRLKLTESSFYVNNSKSKMIEFVRSVEIPGGYIFLLDKEKNLIYHPEINNMTAPTWVEFKSLFVNVDFDNLVGSMTYSWDLEDHLAFSTVLNEWEWIIVATAKEDIIYADISDATRMVIYVGILALIVIIVLTLIISRSITRPIETLAKSSQAMREGDLSIRVEIESGDEFQVLAESFNQMAEEIDKSFSKALELNDELEDRVNKRTQLLRKSNTELEESLCDLEETQEELLTTKRELEDSVNMIKMAQKQLVESEKLAALGSLVAGISHEMNTPIGMGVTSASYLRHEAEQLESKYEKHELKRSDLMEFINKFKEGTEITLKNLVRASELISGFKMIAVDQSSHNRRMFELKSYVHEVVRTLTPEIKRTHHIIDIECDDDIMVDSYPGAMSQILSNLIMNSVVHGFEGIDDGHIVIHARIVGQNVVITYRDDGKGINDENLNRIFEPFFTTKLGKGGSGLGMHIVYNLTTAVLKGQISYDSSVEKGVKFIVTIPLVVGEVEENIYF